ncbi:MarR family winged helix-turn-helix transcriptional regulator [Prescottella defluvii]|uniref:MarR family winged helix-turn-helix transcriptional regulator n=1 Tax=Prescottella defluvii TaxID=1323361 RepID=UPI0004F2CA15|nr:MarR family winged helix-turn-helix transcriptional regulator [Prescottella defluvii]
MTSTRAATVPTERLGFLLAFRGELAGIRLRGALAVTGLRSRQAMTLLHLGHGSIGQRQLADAMGVDPSQLVAILNDLESAGLAERRRDPADRRRHIVEITPEGARTVTRIEQALGDADAELFAELSDEESAALQALLERVRVNGAGVECTED